MVNNLNIFVFDWKRTLYDPDSKTLIASAKEVLDYLKKKDVKLILVGKGSDDMYKEVKRLDVEPYFDTIRFREGDKDESIYDGLVDKDSIEQTVFIGDRMNSELTVGNHMGVTTIWVRQGQFASEEPTVESGEPDYTVSSLAELLVTLNNL